MRAHSEGSQIESLVSATATKLTRLVHQHLGEVTGSSIAASSMKLGDICNVVEGLALCRRLHNRVIFIRGAVLWNSVTRQRACVESLWMERTHFYMADAIYGFDV